MSDLLLDELPTRWHGHEIIPDFRPMVWLVNTYVRGQTGDDPIGFAVSALWRFYKDPHCFLNDPQKIIDAYGYMIEFYKAGENAAESAAAVAWTKALASIVPMCSPRRVFHTPWTLIAAPAITQNMKPSMFVMPPFVKTMNSPLAGSGVFGKLPLVREAWICYNCVHE